MCQSKPRPPSHEIEFLTVETLQHGRKPDSARTKIVEFHTFFMCNFRVFEMETVGEKLRNVSDVRFC